MAREVKDYDVRKNEILDTAQKLFFAKGYEMTSIEEIRLEIGIAKGTFYYYFKSKGELLDELVDRLVEGAASIYQSIVKKQSLSAIEKLEKISDAIGDWKIQSNDIELMKELLKNRPINIELWYNIRKKSLIKISPILQELVEQGIGEGLFRVNSSDHMGEIILQLILDLKEVIAIQLREVEDTEKIELFIMGKADAYIGFIEGVLGLQQKTLKISLRKGGM